MPEDDPSPGTAPDRGADGASLTRAVNAVDLRTILTLVLGVVFLLAVAGAVYVALTPEQAADPYTEFYLLGDDGNASEYPTNLTVGEEATVIVGVTNHENRQMTYSMRVTGESRTLATRTITLDRDETWEEDVSYSLDRTGRVKVRFLLYKGAEPETDAPVYRRLRLWTNVTARG